MVVELCSPCLTRAAEIRAYPNFSESISNRIPESCPTVETNHGQSGILTITHQLTKGCKDICRMVLARDER